MAIQVCMGATMMCSFGAAPASLLVLPVNRTFTGAPAANIMDGQPFVNVPTFGMCSSISNPAVATATSAAAGVLTPMPCVPVTPAPWVPGAPTVLIGEIPALNNNSQLMCNWGGVIQITSPGQTTVEIP
jgi:Domain of unknown function (DUF4280)